MTESEKLKCTEDFEVEEGVFIHQILQSALSGGFLSLSEVMDIQSQDGKVKRLDKFEEILKTKKHV